VDRVSGEPVRVLHVTAAAAVAGVIGVIAASADLALGHGNHTLNNFLACCIVADFLSLIGLGSFAAAGALLVGLLAYDAFWVFGSGYVFGDGSVDSNVMMTVATSESFQGGAGQVQFS
jgi:minor histocompatibility antigen H13